MSERAARAVFDLILAKVNATNGAEAQEAAPKGVVQTLEDAVNEWRKLVAVHWKLSSRLSTESHLRAHILPKLGSVAVTDLTAKRMQEFVGEITAGRSGKRVVNIMATLNSVLKHARIWGWNVPRVSFAELSMPTKIPLTCSTTTRVRVAQIGYTATIWKSLIFQVKPDCFSEFAIHEFFERPWSTHRAHVQYQLYLLTR
jgi:hypothetical protein